MKLSTLILAAALAVNSFALAAADKVTCRGYNVTVDTQLPGIMLEVDSIEFRSDLARMYGRVVGRPNTAQRIDSLQLAAPGMAPTYATDIDGFDFERWFQWEEDGIIPVEIDFKPLKPSIRKLTLRAVTPKGGIVWTIQSKSTPTPTKAKRNKR